MRIALSSSNSYIKKSVIIAGIFGAVTLTWTPLLIQTAPGAIALFLVWISRRKDSSN